MTTQSEQGAASHLLMASMLLVMAATLVYVVKTRPIPQGVTQPPIAPRLVEARGDLANDEQATVELFQTVIPSVVTVTAFQKQRNRFTMNATRVPQGTGSGFMWDDKGHIVTNFHVVQNADSADVTLHDNTVWRAQVLPQSAPEKDLAVLKIDAPQEKLSPIVVGSSEGLLVGQKVFAIGSPFALGQTLTSGIISALGREIDSVAKVPIYDVIQTDAAINHGNSGGPLLDSAGRLIGVNTAILSQSGDSSGIGFAIPVDTVNRVVPRLIVGKSGTPRIGIYMVNDSLAQQSRIKGVIIRGTVPGSPAEQAGLVGLRSSERGGHLIIGDVIVAFEGTPVESQGDLFRLLDKKNPGDPVTLTIEHEQVRREVQLVLAGK